MTPDGHGLVFAPHPNQELKTQEFTETTRVTKQHLGILKNAWLRRRKEAVMAGETSDIRKAYSTKQSVQQWNRTETSQSAPNTSDIKHTHITERVKNTAVDKNLSMSRSL